MKNILFIMLLLIASNVITSCQSSKKDTPVSNLEQAKEWSKQIEVNVQYLVRNKITDKSANIARPLQRRLDSIYPLLTNAEKVELSNYRGQVMDSVDKIYEAKKATK